MASQGGINYAAGTNGSTQMRFERGVAIISIDTEQIWGYLNCLSEAQFKARYPDSFEAHERLLTSLQVSGVSATWFVVGGMALQASLGAADCRMAGMPLAWRSKIPAGNERTAPLWYRHSFVKRITDALPLQEIGLHGGLSHMIWTDAIATPKVVSRELAEGIKALEEAQVRPCSFSYGWDQEAHHELLPSQGIRVYRGRTPVFAYRLGRTIPGALLRAFDEISSAKPPTVWPTETLPGLWNIPSSLFLYPMARWRTRVIGLHSRIQRFQQGLEGACRLKGIFHFCLHPENLAESKSGFAVWEEILDRLIRARDSGDVEILTMSEVVSRLEQERELGDSLAHPYTETRTTADYSIAVPARFKQPCPET